MRAAITKSPPPINHTISTINIVLDLRDLVDTSLRLGSAIKLE